MEIKKKTIFIFAGILLLTGGIIMLTNKPIQEMPMEEIKYNTFEQYLDWAVGGWTNSTWNYRQEINITSSASLTDFPIYLNISANESIADDFSDIRFYNGSCELGDSAVELPYEIENYTSSTAHVWVKTDLSVGITSICMYYNASVSDGQDATNVWDNSYVSVWHMESASPLDSLGNHNGTGTGNSITSAGVIGVANAFDGSGQVDVPWDNSEFNAITAELWLKRASTNNVPISAWNNGDNFGLYSNNNWYSGAGGWVNLASGSGTGSWEHLALTHPTGAGVMEEFVNGVGGATSSSFTTLYQTPTNSVLRFGADNRDGVGDLTGDIDEVRISSVQRSDDWINMSYQIVQNQNTLVTFGSEEEGNTAPTTPTNITCDGGTCNKSVDASTTLNCSGSTDDDSDEITNSIEASLEGTETYEDTTDVSGAGEGGDGFVEGISYEPITSDADSGISNSKIYTHAIDFGTQAVGGVATINSVVFVDGDGGSFPAIGGGSETIGTGASSIPVDHAGDSGANAYVTGDMQDLVYDMTYNDATAQINITGLTAGKEYQFKFYHRVWGGDRPIDFGFDTDGIGSGIAGSEHTGSFNEADATDPDASFGSSTQVYALTYNYTLSAGVTTLTIYIDQTGTGSYHLYGLTNEELPSILGTTTNETNTSYTNYTDVDDDFKSVSNIDVTIEVDSYNPVASVEQGTNDPDLSLEIWNSSDWIVIGNFSLNTSYTGDALDTTNYNFSLTTTDSTILSAWETSTNQDFRIRGMYMDYFNATTIDEINYTNVWVNITGQNWGYIGNHTNGSTFSWDTSGIDEQTDIDLRCRAIDLDGTNTYSSYFTGGWALEISHGPPPEDTCTYTSGTWEVDCSDMCNITSAEDLGGDDIEITGTGAFTTTKNISNVGDVVITGTDGSNTCDVYCLEGGCFV